MQLSTLSPTAGKPVEVRLNLPTGENWADANVGAFFVRQGKEQWSVPIEPVAGGDVILLTFERPGTALVVLSVGRAEDRGFSDSWQRTPYCSKAVVRVQPGDDQTGASATVGDGVTGKVGHKIEILPLAHPATLRVGDHLPVRVYYEGGKRKEVAVRAGVKKPGVDEAVAVNAMRPTDSVGTTWFELPHEGQWRLSWSEEVDGVTHTAELVFEIAANAEVEQKPNQTGGQR
ncbi:MAG: DUF4198 domain-containing protein [Planctomycetes bacterium]|nr:DUF4198 domain-containing protein [Planctomycetota bacterium]